MNKIVLLAALLVLTAASADGQFANQHLSNLLPPTAVNQELLPSGNNVRSIGSSANSWKTLYLDNSVFLLDNIFLHRTGLRNTFVGQNAGFNVTTGADLTAGGAFSLYSNTTGSSNSAFGSYSLFNNSTGTYNTALGFRTLFNNTTGNLNTAAGYRALYQNITGAQNVGVGKEALFSNSNGSYNTALGFEALFSNLSSGNNVAAGYQALRNNTESYNTAIGASSQSLSTIGSYNASLGYYSLANNTTGNFNTGIGSFTVFSNQTGSLNTGVGYFALGNNPSDDNSALGAYALYNNTGTANTGLGYGADVNPINLTNATAVGNGAIATASNQVMLGNTSVTSVKAAGTFVIYSDSRYKKNVKQEVPGLEFIKLLTPLTYTYDVHGMNARINANRKLNIPAVGTKAQQASKQLEEQAIQEKEKKVYTGFLAQDVEKAAEQLKYDFSGVYKPKNENDLYGLSYADFVVPLVKAVQELSTRLEMVEKELASLKNGTSLSSAFIKQNSPNPFTSSTTIGYYIPASSNNAYVIIKDMKGSTIKTLSLAKGAGQLTVARGSLAAGSYSYTLYIDGERTDSKQMLLK